ncbi:hypothetical protein CkaCkLH20_04150 [Colletotrichum karsti]|uniref:Uncharacterized protein n=1 Tax=Colletotrichum karsti TaxID=1095194 RepID=A0A9P6I734_9PEZI|nr:uncharacterized protein CkaCkLH20_04150 [Colletotrichum karsti]KAF9878112.1 hypothetical protein CkaCkLH20_04150 [Colletotrichum karsti]
MAAESKTKPAINGVTNGNGNLKPSFKGSKLYEAIRGMISSANNMERELSGLPDLEKLMESEKRLRKEVEEKTKEIDDVRLEKEKELAEKSSEVAAIRTETEKQIRLIREEKETEVGKIKTELETEKEARRVLIEGFEERVGVHNQTKAESAVASQRLDEAQQHLKVKEEEVEAARQKVAELQEASDKSSAQVEALTSDRDRVAREKTLLAADLQSREAELQIFESDLQQLQKDVGVNLLYDYDDRELTRFRREIDAFAEESRGLVTEFFRESDNTLSTVTLPHHLEYLRRVPLPKSGSTPDLRCLVAQAVIARFLRSHIFQPFFLPQDLHGAGADILEYLSEDIQRATIFRCQILAACDRNGSGKNVAGQAKDEVYRELCAFVPATKYIALQQRLTRFFEAGAKLWSELQHSKQLFLSEDLEDEEIEEIEDEGHRPKLWEEYGTRAKTAAGGPGMVVATLFPQVVMEEGEDTVNVIHPGVGLWSDQTVVLAATQAMARGQANGRVNGDARPLNQRRRSSSSAPSGRS